jgi:hypothetical protein
MDGRRYCNRRYLDLNQSTNDVTCELTDEGLVRIDWDEQSVKFVWKDDNPISVDVWHAVSADDKPVSTTLLVRSEDCVRMLDLDGNAQETIPLPAELRDVVLEWTSLGNGKALV